MPVILMILSFVGAALWFWVRNNPRDALHVAQDTATVIRNAPRKLAFRRQTNAHPVEGIDDPRIAICAIGQSFIELDDLPTIEQRKRLHIRLRTVLKCSEGEAEEMEVLGRWLVTQCNGPTGAITRLSRRLYKLDNGASWDLLQDFLGGIVEGELSASQVDAITDIKRAFKR